MKINDYRAFLVQQQMLLQKVKAVEKIEKTKNDLRKKEEKYSSKKVHKENFQDYLDECERKLK